MIRQEPHCDSLRLPDAQRKSASLLWILSTSGYRRIFGYGMDNHADRKMCALGSSCGHLHHNVILWVHISTCGRYFLKTDFTLFDSASQSLGRVRHAAGHDVIFELRIARWYLRARTCREPSLPTPHFPGES